MNNQELLLQIIKIAEKTGQMLLKLQPDAVELKKENKDFLSDADLKSDILISKRLEKITPGILIYSEENEKKLEITNKLTWIVDPLDGTINFFHQDIFWGISIALMKNKETQLGVIYLPALNQLAGATKEGVIKTKGNIVLKVRKDISLSDAQIWTDWTEKQELTSSIFSKIAKFSFYPQIRLCCSASLLAVATGKISAYIHPSPGPEDIAAGNLIVEKAGGNVTDLNGRPWTPYSSSIVASNGYLHDAILKAIK